MAPCQVIAEAALLKPQQSYSLFFSQRKKHQTPSKGKSTFEEGATGVCKDCLREPVSF